MAKETPTQTNYASRFQEIINAPPDPRASKDIIDLSNPPMDQLILDVFADAGINGLNEEQMFRAVGLDPKFILTAEQVRNRIIWGQDAPSLSEHFVDMQLARLQYKVQISVFNLLMQGKLAIKGNDTGLFYAPNNSQTRAAELDFQKMYRFISKNKLRRQGYVLMIDDPRLDYLVNQLVELAGKDGLTSFEIYQLLGAPRYDTSIGQSFLSLLDHNKIQRKYINHETGYVAVKTGKK